MTVGTGRLPTRRTIRSSRWAERWHTISVIQRRDLIATLVSPGVFVAVALGMLAASLSLRSDLSTIADARVHVLTDAFVLPFFIATTIAMFFIALSSVATVARERDQGTLEVLFYGPVDVESYILAKHAAQVVAFVPMALAIAVLLVAFAGITGLRITLTFVPILALSIVTAAAVAALGLFLSTITRSVRAAFAIFAAIVVLLLALRIGAALVTQIQVTNNFSPWLFVRGATLAAESAAAYISPFGVFDRGVDAVVRGSWLEYLGMILLSVVQCAVLVVLSIRGLHRRGVRR